MVLLGALARFASFRWLCVVLCALSVLVAANGASAATAAQTKTRVWDFELPDVPRLRLEAPALVENASGNSSGACDARVRTNLWQARWFNAAAGGIYDVRARQWSPELGAFLQVDEFVFLGRTGTLWSWPGQNPYRWRDPSGQYAGAWSFWAKRTLGPIGVAWTVWDIGSYAIDAFFDAQKEAQRSQIARDLEELNRRNRENAGRPNPGERCQTEASGAGARPPSQPPVAAAAPAPTPESGARFDPSRAGHIFREAAGHVNPGSAGSQARFARLFEQVASNPGNLRPDAVEAGLITQQAAEAGVQAFTSTGRTGQVWVTVRNGVIQNAGVNPIGAFR